MSSSPSDGAEQAGAAGTAVAGRVSIIVPTRNSRRTIAACIASARSQSYADVELVVVDNHSTDGTPDIGREADVFETWQPERSAQRNRGIEISTGESLIFCDSDMILGRQVAGRVVEAFANDGSLGALIIPERAVGIGYWAACRSLEKELFLAGVRAEIARAYRRTALEAVGGWDEELSAFEDEDLHRRVQAAGWLVGRIDAVVWHDEGPISLRSSFRKKLYYGRWLPDHLSKKRRKVLEPRTLRDRILSAIGILLQRPHYGAGLIALKLAETAGLLLGAMAGGRRAASK